MNYLLLLLLFCQTASIRAQQSASVATLTNALRLVLEQSVMVRMKTIYVHVQVTATASRALLDDLLAMLLHTLTPLPRRLFYNRPLAYKPYVHAVLLLVDDLQALQRVYAEKRATSNLSHTLIYMLKPIDAYHTDVQAALQLLWELSVLNVGLVIDSHAGGQLFMVSYYPFSVAHGCQVIRNSVINRYDVQRSSWASSDFFPSKLTNFYGCTLTCATWEDMPYLVQLPDGKFIGIEGLLLQFMAGNLNFTAGLYWLDKQQVQDTFNSSGWIFDHIFSNMADYSLGGFHYKPANDSAAPVPFSQSRYYFMSHIMLVTNLQGVYSTYEKLAFPFQSHIWLALGLILAVGCLVIWLLRRRSWLLAHYLMLGPQRRTPYYNLFVLAMGATLPTQSLPRANMPRFLLTAWLLFSLVMRGAYQSGMYQLLRDNMQRNPPQTIAAVIAQRYTIALIPQNVRFLTSLPELKEQQLLYLNTSELEAFPALAASSGTSQRLAIITPYEYFGYFRRVHTISRQLRLVRERVFTQQLSFYVRPNSYLVGVLDKQIGYAHKHGFLDYWTQKYVGSAASPQDDVSSETLHPNQLNVLSLRELEALFWLVLWAHLLATLVFAMEILISRCT